MMIAPHVLTGILIGDVMGQNNQPLALLTSLCSHFALDSLPHWNPHYPKKWLSTDTAVLVADGLSCVAATAILYLHRGSINSSSLICGAIAIIPDIVGILEEHPHPRWFDHYIEFDTRLQYHVSIKWGLIPQVAIATIAFSMLWQRK